jgi:hypothetical protein
MLCKFLKATYGGKTAHWLGHSLRDRLREADVPFEAADQIGVGRQWVARVLRMEGATRRISKLIYLGEFSRAKQQLGSLEVP